MSVKTDFYEVKQTYKGLIPKSIPEQTPVKC